MKFRDISVRNRSKHENVSVFSKVGCVSINESVFSKRGGELIKILHVLLKNGFRGFCNASVKCLKTLDTHISVNIGEKKEEKEESQVLYASGASVMLP